MSGFSQSANRPLAATIQRYFDIALYQLVVTAFVTLASTKGLDTSTVLLASAALLIRGYLLAIRRSLLIPENWTTTLTVAYTAFYLIDYLFLSRQFVSTTVHLVLFLMVMRLFSARRDRDYYFLAVIAFLMVLAAAVLTVDSIFLFAFSVFMLCAVATFILMEMKRTSAQATAQSGEFGILGSRKLAVSLAAVAPAILILILAAGTIIFFVLPRMSTSYLSALSMNSGVATGFTDHVELGSIGEIQQSDAVVMHIQFDDEQSAMRVQKWRGISLSTFDGSAWSNPYRPIPIRPLQEQQFDLRPRKVRTSTSPVLTDESLIHYHVLMEPVGMNVFFLAANPQFLQGKYRVIAIDRGGAVYNMDSERGLGVYDAWSLRNPRASANQEEPYTSEALSRYLQYQHLDSRIPELASRITADKLTNYEKADAIQTYLITKFAYTLELPRTRPADPLANFLFERKRGHCEYFASAMAVMLRTLSIPSRVVTGFQPGEFNDVTSQYVVRARDAHAWVEAYFPDRGWVTFDPTPPSSGTSHSGFARLALYVDAVASFWREWIVDYDAAHQTSLGREVAHNSRRFAGDVQKWLRTHYERVLARARAMAGKISDSPNRWGINAVITAVGMLLLINVKRLRRMSSEFWLRIRPEKSPSRAASLWYQKMIQKVARKGWRKAESQTPAEFAKSIQNDPLRRQVVEFTRRYESARFGDSAEDAEQLPELYEEIAASKR